jgi:hypothetical protein
MDHQVEKFGHLGLELVLLRAALGRRTVAVHRASIPRHGFSGEGYRKSAANGKGYGMRRDLSASSWPARSPR